MKKLVILIVLILPVMIAGQTAAGSKKDARNTYTDTVYPFSVTYSAKWTPVESEDGDTGFQLMSLAEKGDVEALFTVIVNDAPDLKAITADEFANITLEDPETARQNVLDSEETATSIEFGRTKIAGTVATWVKYKSTEEEKGVKRTLIHHNMDVLIDGRIYGFAFVVESSAAEKWEAEQKAIIESFTVTKKKAAKK
jgi:hypothetical protein